MASSFQDVFVERQVVARISNLPDPEDTAAVDEVAWTNEWASDYIRPEDDATEPILDVYYPISTESLDSASQVNPPAKKGTVVGLLNANMYFRELIQDILPGEGIGEGSGGVMAVFRMGNTSFTYKIDGPEVTFLQRGDNHNAKFNDMNQTSMFLDVKSSGNQVYTGLPLSEATRSATVSIYPTIEMEEYYVTNNPVIYTVIAVLTFVFTSALFIIYDRLRSTTLAKVIHTAVDANTNVVVLEAMVKKRTRELLATNKRLEKANRRVVRASEAQLQHFACMSHEIRTPLVSSTIYLRSSDCYVMLVLVFAMDSCHASSHALVILLQSLLLELCDWNVESSHRRDQP